MSDLQLELAADILGPLVEDVVFVGGATIYLWLTETGAPPTRATDDVDVICDVRSRGDYYAFAERLRERGLEEGANEPVVCRWRHRSSGLVIDVMPTAGDVLGFTNPWYDLGLETAVEALLDSGVVIRVLSPPLTIATKLAAWEGRGAGDVLGSLDVHDILVLINGRLELEDELAAHSAALRHYVRSGLAALMEDAYFDYAIQDAVREYGRAAAERADVLRDRVGSLLVRIGGGVAP